MEICGELETEDCVKLWIFIQWVGWQYTAEDGNCVRKLYIGWLQEYLTVSPKTRNIFQICTTVNVLFYICEGSLRFIAENPRLTTLLWLTLGVVVLFLVCSCLSILLLRTMFMGEEICNGCKERRSQRMVFIYSVAEVLCL